MTANSQRLYWLSIATITFLGLVVYWPGLQGGFIFDDFPNLVEDPDWKINAIDIPSLQRAMSLGIASELGRPLALLSFALNHAQTALDPFPMKLTGLALHLLNGCLVLTLLRHLFELTSTRSSERMGNYAALLIALAWVIHPLQVSTVLYVIQRMEIGATTGVLLALIAYLRARAAQKAGERAWPWFAAACIATSLGIGFKESAALAPGYALALEVFVLRFTGSKAVPSRPLVIAYAIGALASIAAYVLLVLPRYLNPAAFAYRDFDIAERMLTQLHVLSNYLGQIILPLPQNLLFYYDNFPVSHGLLSSPDTLRGLILILVLAVAAWLARVRWPLISLGIAWFFAAHAMTSNVVPLELAFEHRNYFALLGILVATAQLSAWIGSKLNADARRALGALPVLLLVTLCSIQTHIWSDPFKLAMSLATRNPESPRANYGLGQQMAEMAGNDPASPLHSLAIKQFEHAASLPNSSALAEQALIVLQARNGIEVPPSVWHQFRAKLSRRRAGPEEISALHGILDCRIKEVCVFNDQELLNTYLVAMENNLSSAKIRALYTSLAYNVLRDPDLAIQVARESIQISPNNLQQQVNLARILAASGRHPHELAQLLTDIAAADTSGRFADEVAAGFRPAATKR
ncbi:hypothetical protein WCE41_11505 [Luteimonas sp. MJ246]|uniref:hypothetical protein n=1 Tax=Luteimonas sp. MJ174 TaxID=3129237 RepID=UPI0031BB3830